MTQEQQPGFWAAMRKASPSHPTKKILKWREMPTCLAERLPFEITSNQLRIALFVNQDPDFEWAISEDEKTGEFVFELKQG